MTYIFDGAMGTMLQQAGLTSGVCPELWNIERPETVTAVHRQYVDSGADILETNTFGANRIKLSHYGLENKVHLLNQAGVAAARRAAGPNTKIAGSVGPTGKLIAPLGDLDFDTAYNVFAEQISALQQAGADYILIETIIDLQEMRAALLAAKAVCSKPIICQLSFEADGRTVTGTDAQTAAIVLEALGADIIGANCSVGPEQLLPVISTLAANTTRPIIVQANAGMPELIQGKTVFPMGPAAIAKWTPQLIAAGASYIGGCCGTTPAHIKAIKEAADNYVTTAPRLILSAKKSTALTSRSKTVLLGPDHPPAIIGERINPTGRKALAASIRAGSFLEVKRDAIHQVQAGAAILDVNMGIPGINQALTMHQVVQELSMLVDVPLAIDTTDPDALEAGLKAFPGRALINSVSYEPDRLAHFLPLAKKYGAAILCLPLAPGGVPQNAAEKVTIAEGIVKAALEAGLAPHDLLLDALVLTAAAVPGAGLETLKTLMLYREHFGYPTVMGLSNISFGLPRRDLMNSTFYAMALTAGLDAPILNPLDPLMQDVMAATDAILGHDANAKRYSERYSGTTNSNITPRKSGQPLNVLEEIRQTVVQGEKELVIPLVKQALSEGYSVLDITDKALTIAMSEIGDAFGAGRSFLPQVMLAAETMRSAFNTIKGTLPADSIASRGTVIIATVKGDVHDLGKNIVAALLENNGFTVFDLGKDVSADEIVAASVRHNADIVGLCSLMTTTLPQIDQTIAALKAAGSSSKIIVGGAVVTNEYALMAGADAYAADGVAAVNIAKSLIKELMNA